MQILTAKDFDTKLLPLLPEKYHGYAILQRKAGCRAFETGVRRHKKDPVKPHWYDEVRRCFTFVGKQNKKREVPIPLEFETVQDLKDHYNKEHHFSYTAYYQAIKKALDTIGHRPWSPIKNSLYTHCFRAYFIIDWIRRFGNKIDDLQQLTGITGHQSVIELQPYLNAIETEKGIKKYPYLYQRRS